MKCPYCQSEYYDGLTNCPACGAVKPEGEQIYSTVSDGAATRYPTAIELIKTVGQGKLFLIATIIYTVFCGLTAIINQTIPILNAIIALALWLFYSECKKQSANPYIMSTTPLTMLKVVEQIQYVFSWIGAVIITLCIPLLLYVFSLVTEELPNLMGNMGTLIVLFLVAALISLIAEIILRKGIINYIKGALGSVQFGTRPQKLSKFTPYFWIAYSLVSVIISIGIYFGIEAIYDELISLISSNAMLYSELGMFFDTADTEAVGTLADMAISPALMTLSTLVSLIPVVTNVMFAKILLDAKKLVDESYYPTAEEYFYQKQDYFAQAAAANAQYAEQYGQQYYNQQYYGQPQYSQPQQPYQMYNPQPYAQPQYPPQPQTIQTTVEDKNTDKDDTTKDK